MPMTGAWRLGPALLLGAALSGCNVWTADLPTDEEMIRHFEAHRAEFDSLVATVNEDPGLDFLRVEEGRGRTPDGKHVSFRGDIRNRMERLGLSGLQRRGSAYLEFPGPPSATGTTKSWVHFSSRPRLRHVPSLDAFGVDMFDVRHVDGPWYLQLMSAD